MAYKSTIMGISGRSEKLEPLLSKMSDTALAELRTTMVLPRTLREMISSPAVENDTQVSAKRKANSRERCIPNWRDQSRHFTCTSSPARSSKFPRTGRPLGLGGRGGEDRAPKSCLIQTTARTTKAKLATTKVKSITWGDKDSADLHDPHY